MKFVVTLIAMLCILGFVIATMHGEGKEKYEKKEKNHMYKNVD